MFVRKKYSRRGGPGFTLIELLVVIAIVAILAAILFPVLTMAKQSANRGTCQSNMKQLVMGCLMYADVYNGRTPGPQMRACNWGDGYGWTERLAPYVGGKRGKAPTRGEHRVYQCPSQKANYGYGINWWEVPQAAKWGEGGMVLSQIKKPKKMMLFYELRPRYDSNPAAWVIGDTGQSNDVQYDGPSYYKMPGRSDQINGVMFDYCVYWPGVHGGQNMAFVDGHVAYFTDWNDNAITYTDDDTAQHP